MGPRLRSRRLRRSLIAAALFASSIASPGMASAQEGAPEPYTPGEVVPAPPLQDEGAKDTDDEFRDPYGVASERRPADQISSQVRYILERIEVIGNTRTKSRAVRKFIPLEPGQFLDPESPDLVATEWRLMGTGWFDWVDIRLERGEKPGYAVLIVHVQERNTVIIEQLVAGLTEGVTNTTDSRNLLPWFGFKLTETNMAGLGIRLSGTALVSGFNQGGRIDLRYPKMIKDQWGLRFGTFFLNGREFYGNQPLVSVPCGNPTCPGTSLVDSAVVRYRRGGFMLGTEKDITSTLRYQLDWIGDIVSVLERPEAASETRGNEISPIEFAIEDGHSFVSSLRFALILDRRDDPGITKQGVLLRGVVTASTRFLGSDYDFLQLEVWIRRWWRLPWNHTIRFGAFGGVAFGNTPFFYLFHVSDLTDLVPSRFLEMQLDRRQAPNLLGTSIENNYLGELAWRLDVGYDVPVYERVRDRGLREIDLYMLIGLYSLANIRDSRLGTDGYSGFSRYPMDLTFDFGFRFDTRIGVFQVGFSTLLGFIRL
ncbi:MAG: BamA/TamA family outer membrane protein [Myxococcales bacterium]|nr:BamA/TamA family outer membrane protein [Myxococcales bacterium]MDH3483473.1 BamA/TamA family outer membrane protein [Myxococcales bacterium]